MLYCCKNWSLAVSDLSFSICVVMFSIEQNNEVEKIEIFGPKMAHCETAIFAFLQHSKTGCGLNAAVKKLILVD